MRPPPSVYSNIRGFTLVELAISLMIIGLLIGGILKGAELVENARITQTIRNLKSYDTAFIGFHSIYKAAPGDLLQPGNRLPNCTASPCNIAGDGNTITGPIWGPGWGLPEASQENNTAWIQLQAVGLLTGVDQSKWVAGNNLAPLVSYPLLRDNGYIAIGYYRLSSASP